MCLQTRSVLHLFNAKDDKRLPNYRFFIAEHPESEGLSVESSHWSWLIGTIWAFATAIWCIALPPTTSGAPALAVQSVDGGGRTVIIIVDSLRPENLNADLMPNLSAYHAKRIPVHTCSANFTLPCIQTLLEGKQSPFAAGLSNFTGEEGSAASLPAAWAKLRQPFRMISDHTLDSLYGEFATETVSVVGWPGGHLDHDLRALKIAEGWLQKYPNDHAIIHIIGTDKVAHHQQPGSLAYIKHWRAVDVELGHLLAGLSPKDNVLVTGDHGHGNIGHHTRESIALITGDRFQKLFDSFAIDDEIEQTDLLYFLAFASGVTLPADYEGAFWESEKAGPEVLGFTAAQRRSLGVARGSVSAAYATARSTREAESRRHPFEFLGALLLAAGLFAFAVRRHTRGVSSLGWGLLVAAFGATLMSVWLPSVWLGSGIALASIAFFIRFAQNKTERVTWGLVLIVFVAAALTSAFAEPWRDFFHTRGGVHPAWFVFYAMVLLIAALGSRIVSGSVRFAPEAAVVFGITVLPSGVYYYQAGQNFMTGMVFGSLVAGAAALASGWRPSRTHVTRLAPIVAGLVFFMLQESGGWEWKFFPHRWLATLGFWPTLGLIVAVSLATAGLLTSMKRRAAMLGLFALAFTYAVVIGELPIERFATASVVVLFVTAWISWTEETRADYSIPARNWGHAIVLLGAQLFVGWMMIDGYRLNNVDFSFALDWFGGIGDEAIVYALTQTAASLKYGMPALLMLGSVRLSLGSVRFRNVVFEAVLLGLFELLVLMVQILFGQAFQTERLWELAVADITFESNLILMLPAIAVPMGILDWIRARRDGGKLTKA